MKKKTAKQTLTKDQHRHLVGSSRFGKNEFSKEMMKDFVKSRKPFDIIDFHGDLADLAKMPSKKKSKGRQGKSNLK